MRSGVAVLWLALLSAADGQRLLSRPRRYLVFPEGSTFTWAFCMTIKALTPDVDVFTESVAAAVAYDLPHNSTTLGLDTSRLHRAQRSAIYQKAEHILDRLGMPGGPCVLRTICEGAQELQPGEGLLSEIFRLLLLFPESEAEAGEPREQWRYLAARKAGLGNYNCPDLYPECPLSILGLARSLTPV